MEINLSLPPVMQLKTYTTTICLFSYFFFYIYFLWQNWVVSPWEQTDHRDPVSRSSFQRAFPNSYQYSLGAACLPKGQLSKICHQRWQYWEWPTLMGLQGGLHLMGVVPEFVGPWLFPHFPLPPGQRQSSFGLQPTHVYHSPQSKGDHQSTTGDPNGPVSKNKPFFCANVEALRQSLVMRQTLPHQHGRLLESPGL